MTPVLSSTWLFPHTNEIMHFALINIYLCNALEMISLTELSQQPTQVSFQFFFFYFFFLVLTLAALIKYLLLHAVCIQL